MIAFSTLTHIVIDVDGTLTDGSIYYDDHGNELKKFNTRDGAGFLAAREAGFTLMVLTGRTCQAVERRMREFKVDILEQNVKNKAFWLATWQKEHQIGPEHFVFVGDELNDLAAMRLCAFRACPADACLEVRSIAHYISPLPGGSGVLRDVVHYLLTARGEWESTVKRIYNF